MTRNLFAELAFQHLHVGLRVRRPSISSDSWASCSDKPPQRT